MASGRARLAEQESQESQESQECQARPQLSSADDGRSHQMLDAGCSESCREAEVVWFLFRWPRFCRWRMREGQLLPPAGLPPAGLHDVVHAGPDQVQVSCTCILRG
jgi:hypothetical protein